MTDSTTQGPAWSGDERTAKPDSVFLGPRPISVTPVRLWRLEGRLDESSGTRRIPIAPLPFRVGRKSGLALVLPLAGVSKEHAELFEEQGQLFVRDLNSTNGTLVNGQRIDTVLLTLGQTVQIGSTTFVLQSG